MRSVLCLSVLVVFCIVSLVWQLGNSAKWFNKAVEFAVRGHGCPTHISQVFLLHTPKAAGTTIRGYVLPHELKQMGYNFTWCNGPSPAPSDRLNYSCLGLSRSEYDNALDFFSSNFGKSCQIAASHWDVNLLKAVPRDVMRHTLTITMLRHPVDRVVRWVMRHSTY